jgi:hypothetical protein
MNSNDKIEALQILLEGAVALIKVIKKAMALWAKIHKAKPP